MTQWLIGIFVRFLSSKDDLCGRKQCFLYLQPSTVSQTVEAMRGGKIEKVWGSFSTFLFLAIFSLPHLIHSFLTLLQQILVSQ